MIKKCLPLMLHAEKGGIDVYRDIHTVITSFQNFYLTTEEKIEIGDWFSVIGHEQPHICKEAQEYGSIMSENGLSYLRYACKKIVASNDVKMLNTIFDNKVISLSKDNLSKLIRIYDENSYKFKHIYIKIEDKKISIIKMKLIKRISTEVSGYDGVESENSTGFFISDVIPENEEQITEYEVIEAEQLYLTYDSFEDMGTIGEDEIEVFKKFNILENKKN